MAVLVTPTRNKGSLRGYEPPLSPNKALLKFLVGVVLMEVVQIPND